MPPVTLSSAINIIEDHPTRAEVRTVAVSGGAALARTDGAHVARVISDEPIDYGSLAHAVRRMPRAPEPPTFGAGSPFGI